MIEHHHNSVHTIPYPFPFGKEPLGQLFPFTTGPNSENLQQIHFQVKVGTKKL